MKPILPFLPIRALCLGLFLPLAAPAWAGLGNPLGLWQLNGNLDPALAGFAPLDASTLAAGTDYSFGTDATGYAYLQTQPFATAAKRLTVTNPAGPNGGAAATRTNQWTVVMDVKFDSFAPFAGLLQMDPANTADVTFYLKPQGDGSFGTVVCPAGVLGTPGAVARNVWYRLALSCGNNGADGVPSVQLYLNGQPSGSAMTGTYNGPLTMQSTFHLFSDNNAELRPVRLGSLGLWGETLSAADIARLGGPAPAGLSAAALAYPDAPGTWGTWTEDIYYGFSPKMISATTDPDGRLRAAFANIRPLAGTTKKQVLMMTYRRAADGFRATEIVTLRSGTPSTTPYSSASDDDYVTLEATSRKLRTKIRTAERGAGGFTVKARMISDFQSSPSGLVSVYGSKFISPPNPFPLFPRREWRRGSDSRETLYAHGTAMSIADGFGLSGGGSVTALASALEDATVNAVIATDYRINGQSLGRNLYEPYGSSQVGRITDLDSALTEDGEDAYHLLNYAMTTGVQGQIKSRLTLFRQRITSPTVAGDSSRAPVVEITSPDSNPNSVLSYAQVLLTHAAGEPKWIVWSDGYNAEIRAAKRVIPLPGGSPDDKNQLRKISGGYSTPITLDTFAVGGDAALDSQDRLHVVWWNPVGKQLHYARENAAGGFDEIVLPTAVTGDPAIAIGPGDYPYIVYAGPAAANPNESSPLVVTMPPGLITAYRGDYEDRDQDGRPGLIERAQGSSDTVAESGLALKLITLSTAMKTIGPADQRFETGFQLAGRVRRLPGSAAWALMDGLDTLRIEPTQSFDAWSSDGVVVAPPPMEVTDDFSISGRVRYGVVRQSYNGLSTSRQFFRLRVSRVSPAISDAVP